MKAIERDTVLRDVFEHVGGASKPDFVSIGRYEGLNFDLTTGKALSSHLRRIGYGPGLNVVTYHRPRGFDVFR